MQNIVIIAMIDGIVANTRNTLCASIFSICVEIPNNASDKVKKDNIVKIKYII